MRINEEGREGYLSGCLGLETPCGERSPPQNARTHHLRLK